MAAYIHGYNDQYFNTRFFIGPQICICTGIYFFNIPNEGVASSQVHRLPRYRLTTSGEIHSYRTPEVRFQSEAHWDSSFGCTSTGTTQLQALSQFDRMANHIKPLTLSKTTLSRRERVPQQHLSTLVVAHWDNHNMRTRQLTACPVPGEPQP